MVKSNFEHSAIFSEMIQYYRYFVIFLKRTSPNIAVHEVIDQCQTPQGAKNLCIPASVPVLHRSWHCYLHTQSKLV